VLADDVSEQAALPWQGLGRELGRWAAAGTPASLWWRDDDAAEVTPPLERLLTLATEQAVPLALAVVPGLLSDELAARLAGCPSVTVLQHGWRHANHAAGGEGGWELGDHRPLAEVAAELEQGRERLREAFDDRFLPVLVPPWNHISEPVVQALPGLGFSGLSTFGARERVTPAPGLVQVNAHCDPISWKSGACFAGTAKALGELIGHLQERRSGAADPQEPTGLVTHHLQMDEASWEFVTLLLQRIAAWQNAREVFRP
jgi:hypothetical protein